MKPTRDGFGLGLMELGKINQNVVVLSADLTDSTRAGWFKEQYPDRFFSMGVAEQDMIGTAAGMSLMGKIPFACTFGVFAAGRAWDQLRVSLAYMQSNVKVVGSHGGITVGEDGATHQALEEITLMRALPNMTIIVPCDMLEAKRATLKAAQYPGPVYLRLGRNPVPKITTEDIAFEIGKANICVEGDDLTIIACGYMVYFALEAQKILKEKNINARVVNLHTIRPLDTKIIIESARKTGAIVTVEEHTQYGGLGSAVSEVITQNIPVPMKIMGIADRFGESGGSEELIKYFGLSKENIATECELIVNKKVKKYNL